MRLSWQGLKQNRNSTVFRSTRPCLQKTVPVRNNQQDDKNGIIYPGDGGWGAPVRETKKVEDFRMWVFIRLQGIILLLKSGLHFTPGGVFLYTNMQ